MMLMECPLGDPLAVFPTQCSEVYPPFEGHRSVTLDCPPSSLKPLLALRGQKEGENNMSYSLNSLKRGYIGDYIGDYYRGY